MIPFLLFTICHYVLTSFSWEDEDAAIFQLSMNPSEADQAKPGSNGSFSVISLLAQYAVPGWRFLASIVIIL